jgi:hypothetical protein
MTNNKHISKYLGTSDFHIDSSGEGHENYVVQVGKRLFKFPKEDSYKPMLFFEFELLSVVNTRIHCVNVPVPEYIDPSGDYSVLRSNSNYRRSKTLDLR